jgi:hypothetical protein
MRWSCRHTPPPSGAFSGSFSVGSASKFGAFTVAHGADVGGGTANNTNFYRWPAQHPLSGCAVLLVTTTTCLLWQAPHPATPVLAPAAQHVPACGLQAEVHRCPAGGGAHRHVHARGGRHSRGRLRQRAVHGGEHGLQELAAGPHHTLRLLCIKTASAPLLPAAVHSFLQAVAAFDRAYDRA